MKNRILAITMRIISMLVAVPSTLVLMQILIVDYLLISGNAIPGSRLPFDGVAPSYQQAVVVTIAVLVLLVIAFVFSKIADRFKNNDITNT